jgi:hypothetical protein
MLLRGVLELRAKDIKAMRAVGANDDQIRRRPLCTQLLGCSQNGDLTARFKSRLASYKIKFGKISLRQTYPTK